MRRFQKSTIKDVARRAGVSTTTVSIFVSGREDVCSPSTAERIRDAVSSLNYTPSSLVSGMQKRVTSTIGVSMLSPMDPQVLYGSFFFARLWSGIVAGADEASYSLLLYPSAVRNSNRCDAFLDGRVDGIVFHAHSHENDRTALVADAGMPAVLLTRSIDIPAHCGAVYTDESRTVDLALSYLWGLGHRRIAHIAGPVELDHGSLVVTPYADDIAIERSLAYTAWMRDRGEEPQVYARAIDWSGADVGPIVRGWKKQDDRPTAVFCANDALALAVIAEACSIGWNVPDDLSVVGVDNSEDSKGSDPGLTSIDVPMEAVGREGIRALLRLMQGAPLADCRVALALSEIVPRSSTGRCPARP